MEEQKVTCMSNHPDLAGRIKGPLTPIPVFFNTDDSIVALCVVALWLMRCSAPAAETPFRTHIVTPAINNYAILPGQPLSAVCKSEKIMKIMASRGEYEPASFLVTTEKRLEAVRVEIGGFTAPAGTLPAEAVDVRVVQAYFRRVTDLPTTLPWLLVHDPTLLEIVDEVPKWVTDKGEKASPFDRGYNKTNRLTREPVDTDTLQPADILVRQPSLASQP